MTWLVNLGDTAVTFHRTLHTSSGAYSSGDAIPEFFVFQGSATAPVWAATMSVTDSTGFYRGTFTCVSCTGFTAGLYGSVKVRGVVSGTSGESIIPFFIVPTTTARVGVRLISASSDGTTAVQAGIATTVQLSSASSGIQTFSSGIHTSLLADSFAQSTAIMARVSSESSGLKVWSSGIQTALLAASTAAQASIESTIGPRVAALTGTDSTGVPVPTATWMRKLDWIYNWASAQVTFNRTTGLGTIYNHATAAIATANSSDDGTTFRRPKASS